jgi:6-phosphofructokinase 1
MTYDFSIANLGNRLIKSPLKITKFTDDKKRLLFNSYLDNYLSSTDSSGQPVSLELAGPREKIFFNSSQTRAAIVTCGGLCPGINDVIRSITTSLFFRYNVENIIGIRYGLRGLNPRFRHEFVRLSPEVVKDITSIGGSILSTSRGPQDVKVVVDSLHRLNINILFCIGGDAPLGLLKKLPLKSITEI